MWLFRSLFKQSNGLPNYRRGPQYDQSGAAAFVFEQETTLPAIAIKGPSGLSVMALEVQHPFRALQQPQVYINKSAPVAGLGGLQAGQFISQPLQQD